jgi:hypothetical protein
MKWNKLMVNSNPSQSTAIPFYPNTKGLFGRAPAPLVEWLLSWGWSRFEKRLAKRLHQLD